jgi:hypothetical protein
MNGHKYPREFELITMDGSLRRLRIPGGWIVRGEMRYIAGDKSVACSESLVRVDDPNEDWRLED